jgi:uncharacterized lipoprotein YmbA
MIKMKYRDLFFVWVSLCVFAMMLTGCAGSKPSKFYLLNSMTTPEESVLTSVDTDGPSVLIGPVTLPAYLDRNHIVKLVGNHELGLDEFTRWAEPLEDSFYRVLMENLSLLLKTPKVYAYNSRGSTPSDFQITINVTRFDSVSGGDAYLTAFWTVVGKDDTTYLMQKKSVYHATASSTGLTGMVDAQNRTLTEFSREIAAAIQSLQQ